MQVSLKTKKTRQHKNFKA